MMKKKKRHEINKRKEKACPFCKSGEVMSWSDSSKYVDYLSARGRIMPSTMSGVCVKHQRGLSTVIKQSRHLGLLPFSTQE